MWTKEEDARDAADKLVEEAQNLEVPSWSSRALSLTRVAALTATQLLELGRFHPYVLVFSERLRERLDAHEYRELWKAVTDAQNSIACTRHYRFRSDRFVG